MTPTADPTALAGKITALDQGYNPTDIYNKVTTSLGIPDARTRVQALQSNLLNTSNAIKAVDPSVTARTSGDLVTEAQRGRLVNMEKAPLTDEYNGENQAFGTQNSQLQDLLGQADKQAGLAESDYKDKRQSLADQLATATQQQQATESKREFDASLAAKSSSSGASSKPTADDWTAVLQDIKNTKGTNGMPAIGSDGYINPGSYKQVLANWVAQGGSSADFATHFKGLMNPNQSKHSDWEQY